MWASQQFELIYSLQGKPNTHVTYTSCVGPRNPLVRFLRSAPVHGNLLCWPNRVGRTLLFLRKRASDTILRTTADQSAGPPPSFSPNTAIEVVMKAKHPLTTNYIGLLGPYLQHIINTFNTCSRGLTHQSLIDTGGLQPWRCRLATSHSLTFPTNSPPLST
jgi:hypothetical protein